MGEQRLDGHLLGSGEVGDAVHVVPPCRVATEQQPRRMQPVEHQSVGFAHVGGGRGDAPIHLCEVPGHGSRAAVGPAEPEEGDGASDARVRQTVDGLLELFQPCVPVSELHQEPAEGGTHTCFPFGGQGSVVQRRHELALHRVDARPEDRATVALGRTWWMHGDCAGWAVRGTAQGGAAGRCDWRRQPEWDSRTGRMKVRCHRSTQPDSSRIRSAALNSGSLPNP